MTWCYLILSYLLLSIFTPQVTRTRTGKADSTGIPIEDYLLVNRNRNPLILLVGGPIPILLNIRLISTIRPGSIEGCPVEEVVDNGLVDHQTRDLHFRRKADIRKRRGSRPENGLLRTLGARASGNRWEHVRNIEGREYIYLPCDHQPQVRNISYVLPNFPDFISNQQLSITFPSQLKCSHHVSPHSM